MSDIEKKENFCHHIIALAENEKLTLIPIEYKNIPIETKPKRGRKPKVASALIKQSNSVIFVNIKIININIK